jgi:hypothetical protein
MGLLAMKIFPEGVAGASTYVDHYAEDFVVA